ncbi:hypothetical protein AX17_007516 [Amanita inopinata Kibby_2008]|nr:hypothetical protein AX17_007516 [Amanita inopinata Kibby_2008]
MVSSKSSKTAKHTYAERVLEALSQLRREHRKHAVHMATLRAQVKRNAELKRDKLGPQWSNWVSKAVHKLEDEGILAAEPHGNVLMTPTGKKAVAAARKSLATPVHRATSTATDEESVWKAVANSGARSAKRIRYNTVPSGDNVFGAVHAQPNSTPRRARTQRGRSVVSVPSPVKKAISRMTKAELKAALNSLQAEHEEALMRATSPLTDLDEQEERERLKTELKSRDDQIERMRHQLADIRIQTAPPPGTYGFHHEQVSSPAFSGDMPSSPTRLSMMAHQQKQISGVVRTQSGSLICDVSKQPTPAPSSPDTDVDDRQGNFDAGDVFGDYGQSVCANWQDGQALGVRPVSPVESLGSPGVGGMDGTPLLKEVSRLKAMVEAAKRATEMQERVARPEVTNLEQTLEIHLQELKKQKEIYSKLYRDFSQLERQVSDRDSRVSTLEAQVGSLRSELASNSSEVSLKDTELKDLRVSKDVLEATLSARVQELERTGQQREETLMLIRSEKTRCLEQLAVLRQELHLASEEHCQILSERDAEVAFMTEKIDQLETQKSTLGEQLVEQTDKAKSIETALSASRASIELLEAQIANLDRALSESDSTVVNVKNDLARAQEESQSLRDQVASLELAVGNLREELAGAAGKYESLAEMHTKKCNEVDHLTANAKEMELKHNEAAAKAKADFDKLGRELEQAKVNGRSLQKLLATAEALHTEAVGKFSADLRQAEDLAAEARSMTRVYKEEAAEKQAMVDSLSSQLAGAQNKVLEIEQAMAAAEAMEASLAAARLEVDGLSSQLASARFAYGEMQKELLARAEELSGVRASLDGEAQKTARLEADLVAAMGRVRDAEEDILELRACREADGKSIENLKEIFVKLREVQLRSLEELGEKVRGVHPTPVSTRYSAKISMTTG